MEELSCVAIYGSAWATRFMQDADCFERFKVVAKPVKLILTLKSDCSKERALNELKMMLEKSGNRVVAIFAPNVKEGAYVDESIKVISNGAQWCMLEDVLKAYGYTGQGATCAAKT
jgi:hypothetical protein